MTYKIDLLYCAAIAAKKTLSLTLFSLILLIIFSSSHSELHFFLSWECRGALCSLILMKVISNDVIASLSRVLFPLPVLLSITINMHARF